MKIMFKDLLIRTPRLSIQPLVQGHIEAYHREFTEEVTRYQYPDPFRDLEAAQQVLSGFMEAMGRGDMLELAILGPEGEFLGSVEVFGLREEAPELGIWLKGRAQGMGYGREALSGLLNYLDSLKIYSFYIYEADERNAPSIRLVEKFQHEKGGLEKVVTKSGKELELRTYRIYARR